MRVIEHIKQQITQGFWNFFLGLSSLAYLISVQMSIASNDVEILRIFSFVTYVTLMPILVCSRVLGQVCLLSISRGENEAKSNQSASILILIMLTIAMLLVGSIFLRPYFLLAEIEYSKSNYAIFVALLGFSLCFGLNIVAKCIAMAKGSLQKFCAIDFLFSILNFSLQKIFTDAIFSHHSGCLPILLATVIIGASNFFLLDIKNLKVSQPLTELGKFFFKNKGILNSEFFLQLAFATSPFAFSFALQRTLGGNIVAFVAVCSMFFGIWDRLFASQSITATIYSVKNVDNELNVLNRLRALKIIFLCALILILTFGHFILSYILSEYQFSELKNAKLIFWLILLSFALESISYVYIPQLRSMKKNFVITLGELFFGPHISALLLWVCYLYLDLDALNLTISILGPSAMKLTFFFIYCSTTCYAYVTRWTSSRRASIRQKFCGTSDVSKSHTRHW